MYLEYCNYNKYIQDYDKELTTVFTLLEKGFNGFGIPVHHLRKLKEFLPSYVTLAAPLDYPMGYSATKAREMVLVNTLQSGATAIDYVLNNYLLRHEFPELKKEVETFVRICKDYGAVLRPFIDSCYVSEQHTVANILKDCGVEVGLTSIGYHTNNFYDSLIDAKEITKKSGINMIFSGCAWLPEHMDRIIGANPFGVRLYADNVALWCNSTIQDKDTVL